MAPVGCSQRCNLGACLGHASIGAPTRLTSRAKPTPVQRCIVNVAAGQTLCIERPITSPSCSTWARGTSNPPPLQPTRSQPRALAGGESTRTWGPRLVLQPIHRNLSDQRPQISKSVTATPPNTLLQQATGDDTKDFSPFRAKCWPEAQ